MDSFKVLCPHCGQKLTVDRELLGKVSACPACHGQFRNEESRAQKTVTKMPAVTSTSGGSGVRIRKPSVSTQLKMMVTDSISITNRKFSSAKNMVTDSIGLERHKKPHLSMKHPADSAPAVDIAEMLEKRRKAQTKAAIIAISIFLGIVLVAGTVAGIVSHQKKVERQRVEAARLKHWEETAEFAKTAPQTGDFDLAIQKFEGIRKAYPETRYPEMASAEITALEKAKDLGMDMVMRDLERQTTKLLENADTIPKAADIYRKYSGILADDTLARRRARADELAALAEIEIPRKREMERQEAEKIELERQRREVEMQKNEQERQRLAKELAEREAKFLAQRVEDYKKRLTLHRALIRKSFVDYGRQRDFVGARKSLSKALKETAGAPPELRVPAEEMEEWARQTLGYIEMADKVWKELNWGEAIKGARVAARSPDGSMTFGDIMAVEGGMVRLAPLSGAAPFRVLLTGFDDDNKRVMLRRVANAEEAAAYLMLVANFNLAKSYVKTGPLAEEISNTTYDYLLHSLRRAEGSNEMQTLTRQHGSLEEFPRARRDFAAEGKK